MRNDEAAVAIIFLAVCSIIVLFELGSLIYLMIKRKFPKSRIAMVFHTFAVIGLLCVLYGYFIEPYWVKTEHVLILTDKLKNTELTVVQISDLHCERKIRNEKKLVRIINNLNPDVVLFTGDAVNDAYGIPWFKALMSGIKAGSGKFCVTGNYDGWFWDHFDMLSNTGLRKLDGEVVKLVKNGETFTISGVKVGHGYVDNGFSNLIPTNAYNIFMFHYPGMNADLAKKGVDLFLSGHTHGGQVALPFYGAMVTLSQYGKKFEAGRYDINGKVLYVNRGIGMEGGHIPRVRFFSRPEVTVFHVRPSGKT